MPSSTSPLRKGQRNQGEGERRGERTAGERNIAAGRLPETPRGILCCYISPGPTRAVICNSKDGTVARVNAETRRDLLALLSRREMKNRADPRGLRFVRCRAPDTTSSIFPHRRALHRDTSSRSINPAADIRFPLLRRFTKTKICKTCRFADGRLLLYTACLTASAHSFGYQWNLPN